MSRPERFVKRHRPVSYTHLDVYKRQENDRLLVPVRAIFESLGAEVSWDEAEEQVTATKDSTTVQLPVSYTHLDVYKRQSMAVCRS